MENEELLRTLGLLGVPIISVLVSTIVQLYNFQRFYPTLTLFCMDSKIRLRACDNIIKLTSILTIDFQLSVGVTSSLLIQSYIHSSTCLIDLGLVLGVIIYIICWNSVLLTSIFYEHKLRLAVCWITICLKPSLFCYFMSQVRTDGAARDFFTFTLLAMVTLTVLLDILVFCCSVNGYHSFGKGVSQKVIAAKKAVSSMNTQPNTQRRRQQTRHLGAILQI